MEWRTCTRFGYCDGSSFMSSHNGCCGCHSDGWSYHSTSFSYSTDVTLYFVFSFSPVQEVIMTSWKAGPSLRDPFRSLLTFSAEFPSVTLSSTTERWSLFLIGKPSSLQNWWTAAALPCTDAYSAILACYSLATLTYACLEGIENVLTLCPSSFTSWMVVADVAHKGPFGSGNASTGLNHHCREWHIARAHLPFMHQP